jgi:hypothetical protein
VDLAVGPGSLPLELLKTVVDPEPPLGAFDEKKVNLDINTHREFVKSIIISLYGMDLASECGRSAAFW